jgi:hypothetical protein
MPFPTCTATGGSYRPQEQFPQMLSNLLQAQLLLMTYSGVAMNDPSKGSLLLQLQNSWLRARDDLASSNLVSSNRQQLG